MFNFKMTLGLKISIPIILVTTIFMLTILTINFQRVKSDNEKKMKELITRKMLEIDNNIGRIEKKGIWISSVCSNLSFVKKAYSEYYITGDLENSSILLENGMIDIKKTFSDNLGTEGKIQYHLPPARSFYRTWSPTRGDDISSFRKTVLKVSENHEASGGIEVGRGGFTIRGIVPITGENDKYYGSVETIFPIADIVKKAKLTEDEEFAIFMHTDLLSTATSLTKEDRSIIGDMIFVEATSKKLFTKNLEDDKMKEGLKELTLFKVGYFQYGVFPIFNFNNVAQGVGVIQLDVTASDKLMTKTRIAVILLSIILPLIIVFLVLYLARIFISKPIGKVVTVMDNIANKDITENITETRNDEIGILYNAVNNVSDNFRTIVTSLRTTSKSVFDSCLNLSGTAFNISQNSETQSATTEGISSSME